MKTFKKTFLPEEVSYNNKTYLRNAKKTVDLLLNKVNPGGDCVVVEVLSRNLKGKTDLRGNCYKPTKHVFEHNQVTNV